MTVATPRATWREWRPRDSKSTALVLILVVPAVLFVIASIFVNRVSLGRHAYGDFFAIWSWARVAIAHPIASLYDRQTLYHDQLLLGMPPTEQYPFAYPPSVLVFIVPFGFLPYLPAYLVWIATTFAAYLVASCRGLGATAALVFALVLAPATAACAAVGQSGFLLGALLVGGARLARSRPVLAGILFGLMTYKPQFGVLVPLALLASRQFLCIAAAATTFVGLVAVTSLAFGASAWPSWFHALASFSGYVYKSRDFTAVVARMPTVLANLHTLGIAGMAASALQLACGLFAAAAVWVAWRRWPTALAVPVLLTATYLATPYAYLYDLPALSSAVILFGVWRLRDRGHLRPTELAVMLLVAFMPVYTSFNRPELPIGSLAILAFLALLLHAGTHEAPPDVSA